MGRFILLFSLLDILANIHKKETDIFVILLIDILANITYNNSIRNRKQATETEDENMNIPNMIIEAYISVMGEEKWNSLTADQQHDVIMTIVKNLSK